LAQGVSPGYANLETLSPFRGGRRGIKARSVVPGALGDFSFAHPPLKRWAIIFRLASRDWRRIAFEQRRVLNSFLMLE
jgi:hypothetical protein